MTRDPEMIGYPYTNKEITKKHYKDYYAAIEERTAMTREAKLGIIWLLIIGVAGICFFKTCFWIIARL